MSNSNAPSQVTGDIVIIDKKLPFEDYDIGDSVLYTPPGLHEIVIHRIYDKKLINGTVYFAIKGDSNPQPDAVKGTLPTINIELKNQTITWTSFYSNSTDPQADIVVSYYPGEAVIHGKVILKIPIIGWLLVPFNSPIPEPFGIFPISMFTAFVLIYILISIFVILYLGVYATKQLKKFLFDLTLSQVLIKRPITIKLRNFYQIVTIPLVLFIFAIYSITPIPLTVNNETTLQSVEEGQGSLILTYNNSVILHSSVANQKNVSIIRMTLNESESVLYANFTEQYTAISKSIDPSLAYQTKGMNHYQLIINRSNMFVLSADNVSYPNLHRYFNYLLPVSMYNKSNPIGVMTDNIFLKSRPGRFNNQQTIKVDLDYSFIQDLIQVEWKIQAHFNRSNGVLLYYQVYQTESLWVVPEVTGMLTLWAGIIIFYELLRRNIQSSFDKKQDLIIQSQKGRNAENKVYPATNSDNSNLNSVSTSSTSNDPQLVAKKLSWEEYKKLEEKE